MKMCIEFLNKAQRAVIKNLNVLEGVIGDKMTSKNQNEFKGQKNLN